jgi:hypothetical protein
MRPDDSSVDEGTREDIRYYAEKALRDSGALGVFPTPVHKVVEGARLSISSTVSLDESFLGKVYRVGSGKIRRALSKVIGLLDVHARRIYLDRNSHKTRQTFVSLHEAGHEYLPWQRDTYAFLEDSKQNLEPETKDQFEREANVFASVVLFQGDRFQVEAEKLPFTIKTPIRLSKMFGASLYASSRQYVTTSPRPCALLVYDPAIHIIGEGPSAPLRRVVYSPSFQSQHGGIEWPANCTSTTFLSPLLFSQRRIWETVSCTSALAGDDELVWRFDAFNNGQYGYYVIVYPNTC